MGVHKIPKFCFSQIICNRIFFFRQTDDQINSKINYFSSDESFCNHYITGPKYMHWRKKNVTSKVVKQVQIVVPNTAHPSTLSKIVFIYFGAQPIQVEPQNGYLINYIFRQIQSNIA